MVQPIALALNPPTFDPMRATLAGLEAAGGQIRNAAALQELQLAPERNRLALENARMQQALAQLQLQHAPERFSNESALARTQLGLAQQQLSDAPERSRLSLDAARQQNDTGAIQAQSARRALALQQTADAARRVASYREGSEERQNAYMIELERARQTGLIDDTQYRHLQTQPPTDLFLQGLISQARPPLNELEAAHADLYRAQAGAANAQQGQRALFMNLLTGGGQAPTLPAPTAPPAAPNVTPAPVAAPQASAPPATVGDLRSGRYGTDFSNIGMGINRYVDAIMSMDTGGLDRATVRDQFTQLLRQHRNPLDAVSAMFTGQPMSEANPAGAEYARQLAQRVEAGPAPAVSPAAAPVRPTAAAPAPSAAPQAQGGPRTVAQVFADATQAEQAEILALGGAGKTDEAMKRIREIAEGQKVTGENAARVAMIQTGLAGLPAARGVYERPWTARDWGQAVAGGGTELWDFPAASGEVGTARRTVRTLVEAALRAMTGAAAPPSEVAQYTGLFAPGPSDSVGSSREKLDRLESFAQRYLTLLQSGHVDVVSKETAQRRLRELANGASVDQILPGSAAPQSSSSEGGSYRVIGVR